MNTIKEKLKEKIVWMGDKQNSVMFYTDAYDEDICHLRLNNEKESSSWIFYYKAKQVDLEEIPVNWVVIYNSCVAGFTIDSDKKG